jgi:Pyridoxamine 5'-phosphate oxidase
MSIPIGVVNADFSEPEATAPPWSQIDDALARAEMFWLSTVRRDGRPHVTPLPAIWHEGALHICTGDVEQKAVNLMTEPRCVLATGANAFRQGLDLVAEGTATRVTDEPTLRTLAARWKAELDWDFVVVEGGFRDAAATHGVGLVFAVRPSKVLAFTKRPYGQIRYDLPATEAPHPPNVAG